MAVFRMFCRIFVIALIALNVCFTQNSYATPDSAYPFELTTTATDSFQFNISAVGTFYVDCGDNGTLTSTENDVTNNNSITRSGTSTTTYTCSWNTTAAHTIRFGGSATGYGTDSQTTAIKFNLNNSGPDTNVKKISSISGSLGQIFGTVANPSTGSSQPRFYNTFYSASNMHGTNIDDPNNTGMKYALPPDLFDGISGAPAERMFYSTFSGCSGLTGSIPAGLFGNLSGAPAGYMFSYTFYNCSGLTGSIPSGLFGNLSGTPAGYMFYYTFQGCSKLSGSIPATLFRGISGAPARHMFDSTFRGCRGLTGSIPETLFCQDVDNPDTSNCIYGAPASYMFESTFNGCSGLTGSIPSGLFAGIHGAPAMSMFQATFRFCSGLTGTDINDPDNPGMKYALPPNLFSGISGAPASTMFSVTFEGCTGLSGSIPSGVFGNLSGAPAERLFYGTFCNCSGLTGSIPSGLFAGIHGAPANGMFEDTFRFCSGLTGFSDGANTINYVPSTFLANIETNTSVANQVSSMFVGIPSTSLKESCPAGTYDVTRTQFNDAGKPWCEPCPDGKTSPEGATSVDQCYTQTTINVKYYFYDTNTSTDSCQYGGVLNLPSTPVRTGYTFTGWTYSK